MLDCYSLKDNANIPEFPDENKYVGSFSLKELEELSDLSRYADTIGLTFCFFEDSRISTEHLKTLLLFSKNYIKDFNLPENSSYLKFTVIVQSLIEKDYGMLCFCD